MTTLTSYDLQNTLQKKFIPSLESEQEIEIETEEVIINQNLQINTTDDELAESITDTNQSIDNLSAVDQATETLESLIVAMESSVLTGGFDVAQARLANITLESVATRFDLEPSILNFGLEEVGDDGEKETKSTIGKAKEMISALKDNTAALLNKIYTGAAAALGNNTATSEVILSNISKIRSSVDQENKGDTILPLKAKAARRLTIDGNPLKPDEYVKELSRALSKYNEVVKQYSDGVVLQGFVNDVISGMGKSDAKPQAKSAILSAVKNIQMGIDKPIKMGAGVVAYSSKPYLGNVCIVSKKPDAKAIVAMLNESLDKSTVSQEGVGTYAGHVFIQGVGAMLYTVGQIGFIGGSALSLMVAGIPMTMLSIAVAVVGYYGSRKGVELLKSGFDGRSEEIKKAIAGFKTSATAKAHEASDAATEFTIVSSTTSSMEANSDVNVQALNPKQIQQVLSLLENTANTTRNMKKSLAVRKALIKQVNAISTEIAKTEGNNNALSKAAAAFVKSYLKQTIKFEMDMTTYGVKTMKAAINYIGLSNSKLVRDVIAEMNRSTEQ